MGDIINFDPASANASDAVEESYQAAFKCARDALNPPPEADLPDLTGRMHQLYGAEPRYMLPGETAIPMFSFDRPACVLWQAVFEELVKAGWTQEDAIAWLQSKAPRHELDNSLTDMLKICARIVAKRAAHRDIK